ncbi:cytochrome c oxidase accessory protein CcoG [Aurantivibrio infirmus]
MKKNDTIATDKSEDKYRSLYVADEKVYTRKIHGFYQRIRRYTGIPLLIGFLICPWLIIDARPAMWFDLPARKFYVFWLTFWPQDGMYLAWLLIISAFLLFTVTVLVGRVYCGFTCPQTVWTHMFIWVENLVQGDRNKRIKLDQQDWNVEKFVKKSTTFFIWFSIALISALTFVGYFVPIRELIYSFVDFSVSPVSAFWVVFFTAATFLNAGFMREQVCKYMCPYARFQSVMYDKNTLAVRYDEQRGEKRGPRKPNEDYKALGLGDCIDCSWCVQVCPVDIDIRDGLQYECIDCGLCVDACNSVMDKLEYPRGLIRYGTEDGMKQKKVSIFRPRLLAYAAALCVMIGLFVFAIASRVPVGLDVIRDRGVRMYRVRGDNIENVYTLKVRNMDRGAHDYLIEVEGLPSYRLGGIRNLRLEEGEVLSVPVRLAVPKNEISEKNMDIVFTIRAIDDETQNARKETRFISP